MIRVRGVRFLSVVACTLALGAVGARAPEVLSEVELFRVRGFALEGARHLALAEAVEAAAVPRDANVWDDPGAWEAALERHPLVRSASVRRRLPGTLVLEVEERTPVALVPTPTLEPVDAEGRLLPLDPAAVELDLPVILPPPPPEGVPETAAAVRSPAVLRPLAARVVRLSELDPAFMRRVSVLEARRGGDLVARWGQESVEILFRPSLLPEGLRRARAALADASARFPDRVPVAVDLRWLDQVVVRFQEKPRAYRPAPVQGGG